MSNHEQLAVELEKLLGKAGADDFVNTVLAAIKRNPTGTKNKILMAKKLL